MGDAAVPLGDDEVRRIGEYMKPYLREMVLEMVPRQVNSDTQILERIAQIIRFFLYSTTNGSTPSTSASRT